MFVAKRAVVSYTAISPLPLTVASFRIWRIRGGLFSVALSITSRCLAVSQQAILAVPTFLCLRSDCPNYFSQVFIKNMGTKISLMKSWFNNCCLLIAARRGLNIAKYLWLTAEMLL